MSLYRSQNENDDDNNDDEDEDNRSEDNDCSPGMTKGPEKRLTHQA